MKETQTNHSTGFATAGCSRRSFLRGVAGVAGAAALGAGMAGCTPQNQTTLANTGGDAPLAMKPGTYTSGHPGAWQIWDLPVTVTVSETALLKIEVPEYRFDHGETEVVLESVKEKLFPRIIESQSLDVDVITGATVAHQQFVQAAIRAIAAAQGVSPDGADDINIPGLNDSHLHLIRGGLSYNLELRREDVPSLADALRMLKAQAEPLRPRNGCA